MNEEIDWPSEESYQAAQAMARRTDPMTSLDAAATVIQRGQRRTEENRILDYLCGHPARTAVEIEKALGFRAHRRMALLERKGFVVRCAPGVCSYTGMRAATWRLA